MKLLVRVVVCVVFVLCALPAQGASPLVVYAHRGGAGLAPENTMGAFRQTSDRFGARGVWLEMDTQLDASGDLVVIHDDSLDRTTDCTGDVVDTTTEKIVTCDAGTAFAGWPSFEPVPLLRDVLVEGRAGGWRLMVELKNIPGEANFDPTGTLAAGALVKLVRDTGFPAKSLLVQSFYPPSLDAIEVSAPDIATVLLTTSQLPGAPAGVGFPLASNIAYAGARGYEVCAPDDATLDLTAEMVGVAHAAGRAVVPWTIDDATTMHALRSTGIDGIITNRPDIAYEVLGS